MKTNNLRGEINQRRKYRRYGKNPLSYFRDNYKMYGAMDRGKLNSFNSGLYHALTRAGQLEEAIPKANELYVEAGRKGGKRIVSSSKGDIDKIVIAYKQFKGNASEAARNLPYSVSTVWRYWKNEGLETRKRGKQSLSQNQIDEIIVAYEPYDRTASEAAKHLPYSKTTIQRYWKNEGLETKKHRLTSSEIETIIKAYEPCKGNASEAAKHLPYSTATIWRYWKNEGLETRKRGRPRKY